MNTGQRRPPSTSSLCRTCHQVIEWQKTAAGKPIPLNPRMLTIITADGLTVCGRESHFANCPGAAEFRRNGQRNSALR